LELSSFLVRTLKNIRQMGSLCCIANFTFEQILQENVSLSIFICNNHAHVGTTKYTLVYAVMDRFCANV